MKLPLEVKRLLLLWSAILFELVTRNVYYVVKDSRIVWGDESYIPTEIYIAWPKWMYAPSHFDCSIPDAGTLSLPARRWCLPDSTLERKLQIKRLDALIQHMRDKMTSDGISGPEVNVNLQIILFKDKVLLNPRIVSQDDASYCFVMHKGAKQKINYYKHLKVEYDTSLGGVYDFLVDKEDACAMTYLIRTFTVS